MLQHQDHFHGSDLEKIEKIYGIKKEEIISFSANVNPLGISPLLRRTLTEHIDAITAYPDREYTSLRQCIAGYCGSEAEHVIVGNGSTELISLFIQIEHPKKAMIKKVKYTSSNKKIATVNQKGVVKAKKKGTCKIFVETTDGSKIKKVCKITVKQVEKKPVVVPTPTPAVTPTPTPTLTPTPSQTAEPTPTSTPESALNE